MIYAFLIYPQVAGAAAQNSLEMTDMAQECFRSANFVPVFETPANVELNPCVIAIRNNNLANNDLAATYSNQGILLSSRGEHAAAIISHTQAIDLLENSEDSGILESIYINRGNTYFAMQEYEAANADYSRVILLSAGTQHQALYNRALVFKALGYTKRALEELEHALLLAPDNLRYLASHSLLRTDNSMPKSGSETAWEKPGEYLD